MDLRTAMALHRDGRLAEADRAYRQVLQADPRDAQAAHLLGVVQCQLGRDAEALEFLQRAAQLDARSPQFQSNLAAALGRLGRHEEAAEVLRSALRLRPDFADAHNNLGVALERLGRAAEAAESYRRAIDCRGDYADAHANLGNVLLQSGDAAGAKESYRRAVRLAPGHAAAHEGLAACATERGDAGEAVALYRRAVELAPRNLAAHSGLLYALHYDPSLGPEALYREHLAFGGRFETPPPGRPHAAKPEPDAAPGPVRAMGGAGGRRLRVGYVSPDFRSHTIPRFLAAALEKRDRSAFEVYCYSDVPPAAADATTAALRRMADHWRDTANLSDERLGALVGADAIGILVDLRGHGAGNRLALFARRAAPVQVSMIGYFDTTGLAAMDWRVTDARQDPPGVSETLHTERLARLAGGCWCYAPDEAFGQASPPVRGPPALRDGRVTFGSLNKAVKVSAACAALWARVLAAVPNSRLLLAAAGEAAPFLAERLGAAGLGRERLVLAGKSRTRADYLGRFGEIDVALDTWPFNGITTTCDALWMGVPVVTLSGPTSVSRAGRSILHSAGLPDLAVDTAEAYIDRAASLAADKGRLRELRRGWRERLTGSALLDRDRFAAELGIAYRDIWQRTGRPPYGGG